jgi:hypothetical protein
VLWRRIALLALLVGLAADYSDPTVPGVFAFKADGLFLDGAVHGRTLPLKARPALPPVPRTLDVHVEPARAELRPAPRRPLDRLRVPRGDTPTFWRSSTDPRSEDH